MSKIEGLLQERETSNEREPKIVLHFFRHSEKEKVPGKSDEEIRLSPRGRELAQQRAMATDFSQAVAFGTSRKRTQETAILVMAGKKDEITGDESLEELKEKIRLPVGSKIGVDERLNFVLDESMVIGEKATAAFGSGEYLKFIVEQSDQLAKELDDEINSTYGRQAASVAKIIGKYIGIIPRWQKILQEDNSAKKYTDTLERFFGSHQGVLESFLAKVIETTEGVDRRNEFVAAVNNQGFDYAEGFNVEISQNEPMIHVSYSKKGDKLFVFDKKITSQQLKALADLK